MSRIILISESKIDGKTKEKYSVEFQVKACVTHYWLSMKGRFPTLLNRLKMLGSKCYQYLKGRKGLYLEFVVLKVHSLGMFSTTILLILQTFFLNYPKFSRRFCLRCLMQICRYYFTCYIFINTWGPLLTHIYD